MLPFRAWRYSSQAGDTGRLVAPPYDVIDVDLQSELYERSPHNVVRVDLGKTHPTDSESDNRYTRAADALSSWKRSGVLVRDSQPSVTFVQESFTGPDGLAGQRHGVLAVLRLSEFGEGVVFPHENTLTGPKEDRYRLMSATAMSLSPVFLLYDLPGDEITQALKASLGTMPSASSVADDFGNTTRLWPMYEPEILRSFAGWLTDKQFLVADGHHRYETALRYQKTQRAAACDAPETQARPAYDYCLVYLTNKGDPALTIYPTHRLLSGLPDDKVKSLPTKLAEDFEVEELKVEGSGGGVTVAAAQDAIAEYLRLHQQAAFGLWGPGLDGVYGVRLSGLARAHVSKEHTEAYQELDVAILQSLVLGKALGISTSDITAGKHVTYFKDTAGAFAKLQAGEFQLGCFMNATGLDQVYDVALGGERMPQKTTFFYPKLPTGLLFHDLTGEL